MNIFITNTLTSNQYHEIMELVEICSKADNANGISFLEQELNEIDEFPCFYLMYDGSRLVSYLSVFIPDETQCEIYGATLPEERGRGYFEKMLARAFVHIEKFGIERRVVVTEPGCKDMQESLEKLGARFEDTDYLMSYDTDIKPEPQHILKLTHEKTGNTEIYETYGKLLKIGGCKVEYTRTQAVIYEFEIDKKRRGKGYGTETLLLVLEHMLESGATRILLHVNGANEAAHAMYSHHGFVQEEQIDYWLLP